MENQNQKPQLGFKEALSAVFSKLTDVKGRARRSEFWWFMLVFIPVTVIASLICQPISHIADLVVNIILYLFALSVTARRLHDSGKSELWVYASFLCNIVTNIYILSLISDIDLSDASALVEVFKHNIGITFLGTVKAILQFIVFIFCLLDSTRGANKYGESTKY